MVVVAQWKYLYINVRYFLVVSKVCGMSSVKQMKSDNQSILERIVATAAALTITMSAIGLGSSGCTTLQHKIRPRPAAVCAKKHEHYVQKYCTTAHEMLNLEEGIGTTESDYIVLDRLIDKALKKSSLRKSGLIYFLEDREIIKSELSDIATVLREEGFRSAKSVKLLNEALKSKRLDCDTASLLYLAIAETKGLKLELVLHKNAVKQNHVSMRYRLGEDDCINWEPFQEYDPLIYYNLCNSCTLEAQMAKNRRGCEGPPSMNLNEVKAMMYLVAGSGWVEKGNYKKAKDFLSRALELKPNDPLVLNNIGFLHFKTGRLEKAIGYYEKAMRYGNDSFRVFTNLGLVMLAKKDFDRSLYYLNKAIFLNRNNYKLYFYRGLVLYHKKQYEEALEDYDKALDLKPGDTMVFQARQKTLVEIEHGHFGSEKKALTTAALR